MVLTAQIPALFRNEVKVTQVRALPSAFSPQGARNYSRWFADMLGFNWNKALSLSDKLHSDIDLGAWGDDFYDIILQTNANAIWIGRDLITETDTKFSSNDVLRARGYADVDAEYLQGFLDDLADGRYTDDDGNLKLNQIRNRMRLYLGKARGVSAQASVDGLPLETEIYWRLGSNEKHCGECPTLASISPFFPDDLFTTPGAGDTPCLGNCKCYLEFKLDEGTLYERTVTTVQPVDLPLPEIEELV
jgi:hypothetical protein